MGCSLGRSSDALIDFNFFNHQMVIHLSDSIQINKFNSVDDQDVPIPHFGVILELEQWHKLSNRIKDKIEFYNSIDLDSAANDIRERVARVVYNLP